MKKVTTLMFTLLVSLGAFAVTAVGMAQTVVTPMNLNTATDEEILSIPNVGDRMLHEFKEYRPYQNIAQFQRELGKYVDEAQVAEWQKYVYVPTNPNTASLDDLLALPGVDEATANFIIENRTYTDWASLRSVLNQSYDEATLATLEPYWIFED